jgi:prevent-host-death family protein
MRKGIVAKRATMPVDAATSVGIRELRDHLSSYLDRVKAGETLTITEHGLPIARIIGQGIPLVLQEMIARGEATAATRPRTDYRLIERIPISGSTQDLIDEVR